MQDFHKNPKNPKSPIERNPIIYKAIIKQSLIVRQSRLTNLDAMTKPLIPKRRNPHRFTRQS
jgi:hypothetical protein